LKNNYKTNCKLKGTPILANNVPNQPENTCVIDNKSTTNIFTSDLDSTFNRRSWFDQIICSEINDVSLKAENNQMFCYDDLFTIFCQTSDWGGFPSYSTYETQKIFKHNIKGCIFNMPLLKFIKTNISIEIFLDKDISTDLDSYIDLANLNEGFIFIAEAYDSSNKKIEEIYLKTNNILFIPLIYLNKILINPTNTNFIFTVRLRDAYERESANILKIELKLNTCMKFKQGMLSKKFTYHKDSRNIFKIFDTNEPQYNIMDIYTRKLKIIESPQMNFPPYLKFNDFFKIELWWETMVLNVYSPSPTVIVKLSLDCPNWTEYTFDLIMEYSDTPHHRIGN
jgi:hypothetical protein